MNSPEFGLGLVIVPNFACEHNADDEQKYTWNGELEYLVPYATISTEESTSPGSFSKVSGTGILSDHVKSRQYMHEDYTVYSIPL